MWQMIMLEVGNEPLILVFVLFAAFVSATIHSVSGLAGALILLIFLVPIFDIKTSVPIISVSMIISNLSRAWVFKKDLIYSIFLSIISTALPGMILGTILFIYLPREIILLIFSIFLFSSIPLQRMFNKKSWSVSNWGYVSVGSIYGLVGGLVMGAGLILAPFFLASGLISVQISAIASLLGLIMNITKGLLFGMSPLLSTSLVMLGLMMGISSVPGAYFGRWILKHVSIKFQKLIIEGIMMLGAIFFLYQYLE
tara:strand:+ start:551 stop:1312 length:762 start_codon:yes stop_codon:yes gene_type:complete